MNELLVPIDFSDCTYGLVDRAAELARKLDVDLALLHVTHAPGGTASAKLPEGTGEALLDAESTERLEAFADRVRKVGVGVRHITRHGEPGPVILAATDELKPTMLMMGTHGRTGVNRLLLGSVAEHVLRRAEVPVITVRTQHQPECTARNCAVCDAHRTPMERRLDGEQDG